MRWTVHGERSIYESEWVRLCMADVEVPGSRRFEHHVVRMPCEAAGTVVHDADRGLLLLWRHRFITDTWGWEIPAGRVEPGESAEQAARRETVEETGWRPNGLSHLMTYQPANGLSDQRFNIFLGDGAVQVGSRPTRQSRSASNGCASSRWSRSSSGDKWSMGYRSLRCYTHSPSPACANDGAGRLFSTYLAHRVSRATCADNRRLRHR